MFIIFLTISRSLIRIKVAIIAQHQQINKYYFVKLIKLKNLVYFFILIN